MFNLSRELKSRHSLIATVFNDEQTTGEWLGFQFILMKSVFGRCNVKVLQIIAAERTGCNV